jgi:hypothetical protein
MPRKRRDEEIVLSFWKRFAGDKDCPWAHRVYCVYALAVATGMISEAVAPPGVGRYRPRTEPQVEPEPQPYDSSVPVEMSDFVKQLGGANGGKT